MVGKEKEEKKAAGTTTKQPNQNQKKAANSPKGWPIGLNYWLKKGGTEAGVSTKYLPGSLSTIQVERDTKNKLYSFHYQFLGE